MGETKKIRYADESENSAFLEKNWGGDNFGEIIDWALEEAGESTRGRFNFMVHTDLEESLQCLVNAVSENSYAQPHKHSGGKDRRETFTVVRGHLWVVTFEENGSIKQKIKLDANDSDAQKTFVIETGEIHTVISDEPFVVLELKQHPKGGYDPKTDKEFAPWAPSEKNTKEANIYYKELTRKVYS
ncbi:cupin fold metalloprotein, WbuC family [Candidatus Microgenomates bacterium]|nr:cupin fold metalloprotein, WbuC family [Candidatus Microgenomates bacterium]